MEEKAAFEFSESSWKIEKYKGGHPRTDAVSVWLKKVFPVREKVPFEVVTGGEGLPTEVVANEVQPYGEFLKEKYPKLFGER